MGRRTHLPMPAFFSFLYLKKYKKKQTGPIVPSNNIAGLGLGGELPNVLAKDLSKKKKVWQWKVGQLFLLLSISVAKVPNPKDTWLLGDMLDP